MTSFCHLPKEVLEEILLRVPPKSLKCCKRVCKLWYAMISDQSFINKQLHVGNSNKHSLSITMCLNWTRQEASLEKRRVFSVVTIHDKDEGGDDQLPCVVEEISLPPVPEMEKEYFPVNLVGSHCNGITCFFDRTSVKETFVLCNPELGEFKLLHTPVLDHGLTFAGAGFGYDPKVDDHKCFKLFNYARDPNRNRALVYTLRTDSWREIKIDLNGCCYLNSEGVYRRGVYYWWNMGTSKSKQTILSFDLSEEEFHTIQLPEPLQRPRSMMRKLALWNESVVCFVSAKNCRHSTSFDMWVMADDYYIGGVDGSTYWIKYLTIEPLVSIRSPLAFWKVDELLMQTGDGRFVSYNLVRKKFRRLPMQGIPGSGHAYLYSTSLISIKTRKDVKHKGKSCLFLFERVDSIEKLKKLKKLFI